MFWLLLWGLLVFTGLAVVLYLAAVWTQTAFYEQTIEGAGWRSAATAGVLAVWFAVWAFAEHRWPGRFDSIFTFSPLAVTQLDEFWSEKKTDTGTTETHFRRRVVPPGRVEYVDTDGRRWQRSDSGIVTAILIEEGEERHRFAARLDTDGNFPRDPRDPNRAADVRYVEEDGRHRVMTESDMGTLTTTRYGAFILNVVFNTLLLAVWIALPAVLLGFQWPHAILMGLIGWAVVLLLIWPPLKERVAERRAASAAAVALAPCSAPPLFG